RNYLTWFGWIVSYDKPFALIIDEPQLKQTIKDLQLIGLDHVTGYWTPDVIESWREAGNKLQQIVSVDAETVNVASAKDAMVIDVRGKAEHADGRIPGAVNIPLGYLAQRAAEIPGNRPIIVHCQTGVRSAIAASVLQSMGRTNVSNYAGSFQDWVESGRPVDRTPLGEKASV